MEGNELCFGPWKKKKSITTESFLVDVNRVTGTMMAEQFNA